LRGINTQASDHPYLPGSSYSHGNFATDTFDEEVSDYDLPFDEDASSSTDGQASPNMLSPFSGEARTCDPEEPGSSAAIKSRDGTHLDPARSNFPRRSRHSRSRSSSIHADIVFDANWSEEQVRSEVATGIYQKYFQISENNTNDTEASLISEAITSTEDYQGHLRSDGFGEAIYKSYRVMAHVKSGKRIIRKHREVPGYVERGANPFDESGLRPGTTTTWVSM
jgi:hypothetical protein